jgi:hypothetical protein
MWVDRTALLRESRMVVQMGKRALLMVGEWGCRMAQWLVVRREQMAG